VAACVANLGGESYFIGKVGEDLFSDKIIKELNIKGVKTDYLKKTSIANTALAFINLKENGEREFTFYRKPSADMFLDKKDIENIIFKKDDILHFCSVDLIDMPVKYATIKAIEKCKDAGGLISFDPNVRKSLWNDLREYKKVILDFIPKADIIKLAEDEIDFIFEGVKEKDIINNLLKTAKIVIVTRGAEGSVLYDRKGVYNQKPYKVKSIDTTGAGDSFIGTFLRYYNEIGIAEALKKASAAAAIVCTKKGVLSSLPNEIELFDFIKNYKE
jgi:fructokinase